MSELTLLTPFSVSQVLIKQTESKKDLKVGKIKFTDTNIGGFGIKMKMF